MKMREETPPASSLSSQKLRDRVPRHADRPANADAPELSAADDRETYPQRSFHFKFSKPQTELAFGEVRPLSLPTG